MNKTTQTANPLRAFIYLIQKINKTNVWNCELIDKLDTLVKHHNAYIRNFRNVGMSLDATMKVYEIRVDSVYNDVRRLGYGISSATCMCEIIEIKLLLKPIKFIEIFSLT